MSKIITLTDYYYLKEQIDDLLEQKASISHSHGNITNEGVITNQINKNVVTDGNGKITTEAKPTIPVANATATNIKMNGTQSAGSLSSFARADHVHPVDTSRAAVSHTHSNYLTSHQDISGKEDTSNKTTTISSSSTDTQYPSAKATYTELNKKANSSHTHDDRYYTETEVNNKLNDYLTTSSAASSYQPKGNYVTTSAIKNDLTTGGASNVLSAEQGKQLKTQIDNIVSGATATDHNHDGQYLKTGTGTVTSTNIADKTIVNGDIADGTIESGKIKDGTIVNGDIANTTITGGKLVNGTVTATQLASNSVETAKIKDGAVTNSKLSATVISNGTDLNTIKTIGFYAQPTSANTSTMVNLPNNIHRAFTMIVEPFTDGGVTQTLTFWYDTSQQTPVKRFVRNGTSSWSKWIELTDSRYDGVFVSGHATPTKPYLRLFNLTAKQSSSSSSHIIFEIIGNNNDRLYAKIRVDMRQNDVTVATSNSSYAITPLEVYGFDLNQLYFGFIDNHTNKQTVLDIYRKVGAYTNFYIRYADDHTRDGTVTMYSPVVNSTESYTDLNEASTLLYNANYTSTSQGGTYSEVTNTIPYTNINANKFVKRGGTSSQFLKADGNVDSNVYIHTAGTNLSKSNNTLNHATSGVGAKSSGLYKTTIDAQGHITNATSVAKADITGLGIPAQDTTYSADRGISNVSGKFGHSNASVTAQTTSALKKIKYDTYGHITGTDNVSSTDIANLGVKITDTVYTHPTSYGAKTGVPTANATLTHGGTFTVTQPVTDAMGHVTALNTRTYTLPKAPVFNHIDATSSATKNLNDYKTGGFYYCSSDTNEAPYITGQPLTSGQKSFFLLVETWGETSTYVKQTLTYCNNNTTYIRTCSNNTWGGWQRTDGGNKVDKTGGVAQVTDANANKYTNIGSLSSGATQQAINNAINTALGGKQASGSYAAANHTHNYSPIGHSHQSSEVLAPTSTVSNLLPSNLPTNVESISQEIVNQGINTKFNDTGLVNFPYNSNAQDYSSEGVLKIRKIGNIVTLGGIAKTKAQISANGDLQIGTLSQEYYPPITQYSMTMFPTDKIGFIQVKTDGKVYACLRSGSSTTVGSGTYFPINMTWMVD